MSQDNSEYETVLYCFTRESTTEDDIQALNDVLADAGYTLSTSEGEGDNILVQREKDQGSALDVSAVLEG